MRQIINSLILLSILGVFSSHTIQGQCYITNANYIKIDGIYDSSLQDVACDLSSKINIGSSLDSFKIFSFGPYRNAVYFNPADSYKEIRKKVYNEVLSQTDHFLLFIKEINEEDELVFHSFISLPDQAEYQHIDEATKQLIEQSIDKQIFENIKNGMTPFNSEIEGIRLFEEMIDESYLLDLSQLEDVVIVPADTDIIFQIELPASTTLASRDDDGYEATVVKIADGVNDLNPANLSELIPLNLNIGSVPVSIGYAISSKLNNIQEKNAATAFYNNCERDIVIHFSIEYENATVLDGITYVTGGNVVIQIENNMTIEKANQIVNQEIHTQLNNHLQYSLPSDAGTTITNHHQTEEDRALSLLKLGYNHLVNRVEDLGMTIDDIAPDEDEFAYAIGTGLFDGLMGTIFGIFELSKGMLKAGGGCF